jgi:hypothetical protein
MAKRITITVNFPAETLTKRQLSRKLNSLIRDYLSYYPEGELPDEMKSETGSISGKGINSVFTLETVSGE